MLNVLRPRKKDASSEQPSLEGARTGAEGEEAAAAMLKGLGWRILARNWRSGHLELDIVAEDGATLVFVEVKTRAKGGMQRPFEALTAVKKERLVRAAQAWMAAHDAWGVPCRFDLACVERSTGTYQTELIRNVIEYADHGTRHAVGGGNSSWQPW
ncbi:YraN family protein [uncultured Mailhella sp.]|uniref:YraN family protein n=1 Tax=uncultured Mailhella sp. TaxID=1981031 RepID=UPI0025FB63E3|nr:YraN family protein [uncultured Mailhella sp.]